MMHGPVNIRFNKQGWQFNPGSSVSTLSKLRTGQPKHRGSFPDTGHSFFFCSVKSRPALALTQPSSQWAPGSSPAVELPRDDAGFQLVSRLRMHGCIPLFPHKACAGISVPLLSLLLNRYSNTNTVCSQTQHFNITQPCAPCCGTS